MRRLLALIVAALPGAAGAQDGERATVPLGEVRDADAMALADRLLPPDVRARVVEGSVRRQFLPGQVYRVGYRERGRPAGPDLCEKMAHAVQLSAPSAPGGTAPADTPLTVGTLASGRLVAILPSGQAATPARCAAAPGYIAAEHETERTLAAYRVLFAAMAAAERMGALPFALTCTVEKPDACADARRALATLPMDALTNIQISCVDEDRIVDDSRAGVRLISCRPLRPGQPYKAEVAFGMSGEDGQSWRVQFVHAERWPGTIALSRSTIIHH